MLAKKEFDGIIPQTIIDQLTSLLNIASTQANDLIVTYLVNEFTGSLKGISSQFSSEKNIQSFIEDVADFYYVERLYSLLVLKEILSNIHDDSQHVFKDEFKNFIAQVYAGNSPTKSIINQLVKLNHDQDSDFSQASDSRGNIPRSLIRERFELNQLLVLANLNFPPDIQYLVDLLNLYSQSCHTRDKFIGLEPYLEQVAINNGILESLIVVQGLSIGKLFSAIDEESGDHIFLGSPSKLQQLESLVNDLSFSVKSNSIIFLGWIIVRSWEIEGLPTHVAEKIIKHFGSLAIDLKVFEVLSGFFSSNFFGTILSETMVGSSLKRVTGDFLSILFKIYETDKLVGEDQKSYLFQLLKEIEVSDQVATITFDTKSESGLLTILKDCLYNMPSNPRPFLEIATSISSTKNAFQLFQLMSDIGKFNEVLTSSSPHIELTDSLNYYRSTSDRATDSRSIYIRKGQIGKAIGYSASNSTVTIQWHDVSISAWTILNDMFKAYYESLSVGRMQQIDDDTLCNVILINNFCSSVVSSNIKIFQELKELLKQVLEIFKLLSRHPKIPRKYLASVLELFAVLAGCDSYNKDTSNFWITVGGLGLLPYPEVPFSPEDISNDFNPSFVGMIINTIECVKGEYALTISFLNYIFTILDVVPVDEILISSLNFIFGEIFPQFQLWFYQRSREQQTIGFLCLTIARKASTLQSSSSRNVWSVVLKILSSGRASETLLNIIKAGIITSACTIKNIGVHEALNTEEVVSIKCALLLLEKILSDGVIGRNRDNPCGIEHLIFSRRGIIVKTLTDKTAVASQNFLLVLAHYVFQNVDSSLASQAASLMRVIAFHYPLSLMSCFGVEADSVKEHFLAKLESPTEDIAVKVSILDFLAECVSHQPGLIEVFVTQEEIEEGSNSVVDTVLLILEEKRSGVVFCPPELHSSALKFLTNFWINTSLPVLEHLKKNPNLWALLTFPFLEPNEETFLQDFQPKIISCIEKIMAREIFFVKRMNNQSMKPDPGFNCVLSFLPTRIPGLSLYLKEMAISEAIQAGDDESLIIHGWKDLLVSVAHFTPVEFPSEVKADIFFNLLESIVKQIQLNGSQDVICTLADTCLLIINQWSPVIISSPEKWFNLNSTLMYVINEFKNSLSLKLLITIQSYITRCMKIMLSAPVNSQFGQFNDLVHPASDLLLHSLRILDKSFTDNRSSETIILNLCSTTMSLFNLLLDSTLQQSVMWIGILKSNDILGRLTLLLDHFLCNKLAIGICENIMSILLSVCSDQNTIGQLVSISNINWIKTALKYDYFDSSCPGQMQQHNRWSDVYCSSIKLSSALLINLKQFFVNDALHLLVVNLNRFTTCLQSVRSSPTVGLLEECKQVLTFLKNLSKFKMFWISNHPSSFQAITNQVSVTIHSIASFLTHRNLFYRLLAASSKTSFISNNNKFSVMKQQQPNIDLSFSPMSKKTITSEPTKSESDPKVELLLRQIALVAVQFLVETLPSLEELLVIRRDPSKSHQMKLFLDRSFVEPNIDCENGVSFGSLLTIFDDGCESIRKVRSNKILRLNHRILFSTLTAGSSPIEAPNEQ